MVADNTLIIKQKSTLPVSKTRQDKSLFCSLSGTYPPPQTRPAVPHAGRGSIGLLSGQRRVSPDQKAQEHISSVEMPFLPDILPCIVGGIFWRKVPRVPCPSRCPSVRPARSHSLPVAPARPSAAFTSARCEPIPAFPLPPEPPTCPVWPSATSAPARCEPFPANRLTPSSRDSGS